MNQFLHCIVLFGDDAVMGLMGGGIQWEIMKMRLDAL